LLEIQKSLRITLGMLPVVSGMQAPDPEYFDAVLALSGGRTGLLLVADGEQACGDERLDPFVG